MSALHPPRGPGALAACLYALMVVASLAQTALVPLLPGLADDNGISTATTAALIAAPGAATFAVALPAGAIADRVGARRVTLGAGVLLAAGVLAQAVPGTEWLLGGRLVFGIAYGIAWTTAVAWFAQDDAGPRRQGAVVTSAASGVAAGPAFGALLAAGAGAAAPFVVAGLIAAAVTVALAIVSRGAPAASRPRPAQRPRSAMADAGRGLAGGALALALSGATNATLQLLVPMQLHRTGASTASIGLAFSAAAGLYIAISAVVVRLGHRAATPRTNALAALVLALALLPAGSSASAGAVLLTMALTVGPRATLSTIAYPLATQEAERAGLGRGTAIGLLNGAWAAAALAAPFVAEAVSGWAGMRAAWLATLAIAFAAATWLLADRGARLRPSAA